MTDTEQFFNDATLSNIRSGKNLPFIKMFLVFFFSFCLIKKLIVVIETSFCPSFSRVCIFLMYLDIYWGD